jgi:hypothetical protein
MTDQALKTDERARKDLQKAAPWLDHEPTQTPLLDLMQEFLLLRGQN